MTFSPPSALVRQRYEQTRYRSPYLMEFRARDGFRRDGAGLFVARSGQGATFSRSSAATATDSLGSTATWPSQQPRVQVTSGVAGLLLGSADLWWWEWPLVPIAMTGTITFVDRGPADNDGLLYIGNAGNTGARLWIEQGASVYELHHDNGSVERTALVTGSPTSGQLVALRFALNADGSIQLWQSIAGGDETTGGASASNTLAAAWSDERMYLNSRGSGNVGDNEFQSLIVEAS